MSSQSLIRLGTAASASRYEDLASSLRLAVARLGRVVRRSATAKADLTLSQFSALANIGATGRTRLSDLATSEQVAPATLTRTVASLEQAGLVERFENECDKRSTLVGLSEAGQELFETIKQQGTAELMQRLLSLEESELDLIEAAMPVLVKLTEHDACKASGQLNRQLQKEL